MGQVSVNPIAELEGGGASSGSGRGCGVGRGPEVGGAAE